MKARMLTPADYQQRREAIEASYQKERAKAENPHPLWRAVASFRGRPFTRAEMRERLDVRRTNSVSGDTTLNQRLARMVHRGLLRRVAPPNGYASGLGAANYYQAAVDIAQRVAKAKRCRDALLAVLEETWRESPFYGLTEQKIRKLPAFEWTVLKDRLAGDTLEQIGKSLGVTRECIRQVQAKAFERLQNDQTS